MNILSFIRENKLLSFQIFVNLHMIIIIIAMTNIFKKMIKYQNKKIYYMKSKIKKMKK